MYPFVQFVTQLVDDRQYSVPAAEPISARDRSAVAESLAEYDRLSRSETTATELPAFHAAAAVWGAEKLFQAGRLLLFQHAGRDAVAEAFDPTPSALPDSPAVHYSVDLAARFLPDLVRLARASGADAPVIEALLDFGAWWPLSSAGLGRIQTERTAAVVSHPALCELYVRRLARLRNFEGEAPIHAALTRAVGGWAVCPIV